MDKERKLLEKSVQAKAEALRDDDNVFDVSYENQGDGAETVSATDIKVCMRLYLGLHKHSSGCICVVLEELFRSQSLMSSAH